MMGEVDRDKQETGRQQTGMQGVEAGNSKEKAFTISKGQRAKEATAIIVYMPHIKLLTCH